MKNINKNGFTLIELLAVIVLLAIVGIVGANLIITRLNKAKADTVVNDFMDLQKEIAYKMMNDNICGDKNFKTEFTYKLQKDGNYGFYRAYDCTEYYDINKDDYKLFLFYGKKYYNKNKKEWTSGDGGKYSYYKDPDGKEFLLTSRNGKYYDIDDKNVTVTEGWTISLDPNYLQIQLGTKKTGKFKSVSFNKEQIKKICESTVKGECKIVTSRDDLNVAISVVREL